jgi:hypothetical protein
MKATLNFLAGLGLLAAGVGIYTFRRLRKNSKQMLNEVADEGYETAMDILYPQKQMRDCKLHYGPVLPA